MHQAGEGELSFRREELQQPAGIPGRGSRLTIKATLDEDGNLVPRRSSRGPYTDVASVTTQATLDEDGNLVPRETPKNSSGNVANGKTDILKSMEVLSAERQTGKLPFSPESAIVLGG
jgi:hypothetical protein